WKHGARLATRRDPRCGAPNIGVDLFPELTDSRTPGVLRPPQRVMDPHHASHDARDPSIHRKAKDWSEHFPRSFHFSETSMSEREVGTGTRFVSECPIVAVLLVGNFVCGNGTLRRFLRMLLFPWHPDARFGLVVLLPARGEAHQAPDRIKVVRFHRRSEVGCPVERGYGPLTVPENGPRTRALRRQPDSTAARVAISEVFSHCRIAGSLAGPACPIGDQALLSTHADHESRVLGLFRADGRGPCLFHGRARISGVVARLGEHKAEEPREDVKVLALTRLLSTLQLHERHILGLDQVTEHVVQRNPGVHARDACRLIEKSLNGLWPCGCTFRQ